MVPEHRIGQPGGHGGLRGVGVAAEVDRPSHGSRGRGRGDDRGALHAAGAFAVVGSHGVRSPVAIETAQKSHAEKETVPVGNRPRRRRRLRRRAPSEVHVRRGLRPPHRGLLLHRQIFALVRKRTVRRRRIRSAPHGGHASESRRPPGALDLGRGRKRHLVRGIESQTIFRGRLVQGKTTPKPPTPRQIPPTLPMVHQPMGHLLALVDHRRLLRLGLALQRRRLRQPNPPPSRPLRPTRGSRLPIDQSRKQRLLGLPRGIHRSLSQRPVVGGGAVSGIFAAGVGIVHGVLAQRLRQRGFVFGSSFERHGGDSLGGVGVGLGAVVCQER
mmetsp:Transcript_45/g.119  ORF Transcript_45/g.119 Transcript_45/m.119 type:complete len:328 (+) Transcript_45:708-1691(+)